MNLKIVISAFVAVIIAASLFISSKKKQLTTLWIDTVPLQVEVVSTPAELQKGLMYRKELPENQGMLFVFDGPGFHAFWMKNTYIPLAIAFISPEGQITQIDSMEPLDTLNTHNSRYRVKYAIEVNKDWFARHKINIGNGIRGLP